MSEEVTYSLRDHSDDNYVKIGHRGTNTEAGHTSWETNAKIQEERGWWPGPGVEV